MTIEPALADEIERLADLVRRQHPSLDSMMLASAGEFQTRTVSLGAVMAEAAECLAESFRARCAEDFPMLYFAWGKARVGSTALSNLFGMAGMPSYYQPLKAVLRDALTGRALTPWIVPSAKDQPHIFSKETAGPYVVAESLFNPLQLLIDASYPRHRLHLLMLDRDPASALASWFDKLSCRAPQETLLLNYVVAALNALRVESCARTNGIPVTHYVYEASKEAVSSVRLLFHRLGLASRFTEGAVTDWGAAERRLPENARVIFPDEPTVYKIPGLHASDVAYRFRDRATNSLGEDCLEILERCGVNDVYRASVLACVRDLSLSASDSKRLFGPANGVAA